MNAGFAGSAAARCSPSISSGGVFDPVIFIGVGTLDEPDLGAPNVHYGAEGELSWMHREDGVPRIRIDVTDPAEQNALFEKMIADATGGKG